MKLSKTKYEAAAGFGYCQAALDFIKETEDDEAKKRVDFLSGHINNCDVCKAASIAKKFEFEVSKVLNRVSDWENNIDLTGDPNFGKACAQVFRGFTAAEQFSIMQSMKKAARN